MVLVKNYRVVKKEDYYCIQSFEIPICPNCQNELRVRGSKKRWVIELDGMKRCYNLRQLECPKCKKIHLEYFDKIVPYKHYSAEAIQDAISQRRSVCPAENSTIREWRRKWE